MVAPINKAYLKELPLLQTMANYIDDKSYDSSQYLTEEDINVFFESFGFKKEKGIGKQFWQDCYQMLDEVQFSVIGTSPQPHSYFRLKFQQCTQTSLKLLTSIQSKQKILKTFYFADAKQLQQQTKILAKKYQEEQGWVVNLDSNYQNSLKFQYAVAQINELLPNAIDELLPPKHFARKLFERMHPVVVIVSTLPEVIKSKNPEAEKAGFFLDTKAKKIYFTSTFIAQFINNKDPRILISAIIKQIFNPPPVQAPQEVKPVIVPKVIEVVPEKKLSDEKYFVELIRTLVSSSESLPNNIHQAAMFYLSMLVSGAIMATPFHKMKWNQFIEAYDTSQLSLYAQLFVACIHLQLGNQVSSLKEFEGFKKDLPKQLKLWQKVTQFIQSNYFSNYGQRLGMLQEIYRELLKLKKIILF